MSRARRAAAFLAAGITVAVLVLLSDPGELAAILAGADPTLVALGAGAALLAHVFLGLAWDRIVGPVLPHEPRPAVPLYFSTLFLNLITPFGQAGGEPAMAALVTRTSEAGPGEALGRMVAADLVNATPFFTLTIAGAGLGLATLGTRPLLVRVAAVSLVLLAVVVGTVLAVAARQGAVPRLARRTTAGWGRILGALGVPPSSGLRPDPGVMATEAREAMEVAAELREEPRNVAWALGWNHAGALADVASVYVLLLAVGTPPEAPFLLLLALPASMLAIFLPFPGGLGGVEAALAVLTAGLAGVPLAGATAAALLFRAASYGGGLTLGAAALASRSVDAAGQAPR